MAESFVADLLEARGFEILFRNLRLGPLEIDIVARAGSLVILCEVKARLSNGLTNARDAITARKREHLRAATRRLASKLPRGVQTIRFDVACVSTDRHGRPLSIEYFAHEWL